MVVAPTRCAAGAGGGAKTFPRRHFPDKTFPRTTLFQRFPRRAAAQRFPRRRFWRDVETFPRFSRRGLDVETFSDVETSHEMGKGFHGSPCPKREKGFHVPAFRKKVSTSKNVSTVGRHENVSTCRPGATWKRFGEHTRGNLLALVAPSKRLQRFPRACFFGGKTKRFPRNDRS